MQCIVGLPIFERQIPTSVRKKSRFEKLYCSISGGRTSVSKVGSSLLTFATVCLKLTQVRTLRVPPSYITKCLEERRLS
jgi:hypothetical protein